jgi:hypothetical protein
LSGKRHDRLPPTDSPKKMLHYGRSHFVNLTSDDRIHNASLTDIQRQSFAIDDVSGKRIIRKRAAGRRDIILPPVVRARAVQKLTYI